jgi:radical SAM superfamily enzyme YgiQ (UPF0313 family)
MLGLYSSQYPAIGESHGLSVVAGQLRAAFPAEELEMHVIDMMQWGEENPARAAKTIYEINANIVAIGLPYGTYSVIKRYYNTLRSAIRSAEPLIAFGGPVATYLSSEIVTEVAPESVVIRGEADQALPRLVELWRRKLSYASVPNLYYADQAGRAQGNPRHLADLSVTAPPYRGHIPAIRAAGGQIYCESSRGCSWAACTFCLRGLTDVLGRGHEYRRKATAALIADFESLHALGVHEITFADEDFLGPTLTEAEEFVDDLLASPAKIPKFDASVTVHSVFARKDTGDEDKRRREMLADLVSAGLQKAFLGVESCSPTQLRRFAKGHTREQAALAARRLQELGIRVEIGVILFDPLCTLAEIRESLLFMRQHELAALASGLSNELRLQVSSHYLTLLNNYERQHDTQLRSTALDPDTLSYKYEFSDPFVAELFGTVDTWNRRLHPLYYPAKSLSRFGSSGAIGAPVFALRDGLTKFRTSVCDALIGAIDNIMSHGASGASLNESFPVIARELADCLIICVSALGPAKRRHPVVQRVLAAARNVDQICGAINEYTGVVYEY